MSKIDRAPISTGKAPDAATALRRALACFGAKVATLAKNKGVQLTPAQIHAARDLCAMRFPDGPPEGCLLGDSPAARSETADQFKAWKERHFPNDAETPNAGFVSELVWEVARNSALPLAAPASPSHHPDQFADRCAGRKMLLQAAALPAPTSASDRTLKTVLDVAFAASLGLAVLGKILESQPTELARAQAARKVET